MADQDLQRGSAAPTAALIDPPEPSISAAVADHAARRPDAVAASCGSTQLTYATLHRSADRLAHALRRRGVGEEDRVAVLVRPAATLPAVLLGVWRSAAAYVPLDPDDPPTRTARRLASIAPAAVVADPDLLGPIADTPTPIVTTDVLEGDGDRGSALPYDRESRLAYVIFTSGSTGRPKPVAIEHRAVERRVAWMAHAYGLTGSDRVLQFHPLSLDAHVEEVFPCLRAGARLVVKPPGPLAPPALVDEIGAHGVSVVSLPTAYWHELVADLAEGSCTLPPCLRLLIIGGEQARADLVAEWHRHSGGVRLLNTYGPTEACVIATATPLTDAEATVTIGHPIDDTTVAILDRDTEPVPSGSTGELALGGDGLARGYFGQPALTADRFRPDPDGAPGGRRYLTGDRVLARDAGALEFVGRCDRQVKIDGRRLELDEVETELRALAGVRDARVTTIRGEELAADVTVEDATDARAVRRLLAASVSPHMVPRHLRVVERLPPRKGGRDHFAVAPPPGPASEAAPSDGHSTPVEVVVSQLFAEALGLPVVALDDDFFDLGGRSLAAIRLVRGLQRVLGEVVHVAPLFDAPTVRRFCGFLESAYPQAVARLSGTAPAPAARARAEPLRPQDFVEFRSFVGRNGVAGPTPAPAAHRQAAFILGPPRSGTTLLRVMLAGHPALFAPPELDLLSFATVAERSRRLRGRYGFWLEGLLRAVMELQACSLDEADAIVTEHERAGASTSELFQWLQRESAPTMVVDKSTTYVLDPGALDRAEQVCRGALYIHLTRHPAATTASFVANRLEQIFLRQPHDYPPEHLAELVWTVGHRNVVEFLQPIPASRRLVVRFEDLVHRPAAELARVCDFLGVGFDDRVLAPYDGRADRMTDGVRPGSVMVGDRNFVGHRRVRPELAGRNVSRKRWDALAVTTVDLARSLGYGPTDTLRSG